MTDKPKRVGPPRWVAVVIAAIAFPAIIIGRCSHHNTIPTSSPSTRDPWIDTPLSGVSAAPTRSSTLSLSPGQIKDAEFVAVLMKHEIPFKDHDDAVALGATVCVYLDQPGTTLASAGAGLEQYRPGLTDEQAGYLIGAAIGSYCPDKRGVFGN